MHFKWDSEAAEQIADELNRLEEELNGCAAEMGNGSAILQEMQGGMMSEAIERYVTLAVKLKRALTELEERFHGTCRGIHRANELFEENERRLRRRIEGLDGEAPVIVTDPEGPAAPPVSVDHPATGADDEGVFGTTPIAPWPVMPGVQDGDLPITGADDEGTFCEPEPAIPWPLLPGVRQTVAIDMTVPGGSIVIPLWLQNIIDGN